MDIAANTELLSLYKSEKYSKQFNDRKSVKKYLWQSIGKELMRKGFNFGTIIISEIGEKCENKWKNLQRRYHEYNTKYANQTGGRGGVAKPDNYNEVHDILSVRDAENPKRVLNSAPNPKDSSSSPATSSTSVDISKPQISSIVNRRPLKSLRCSGFDRKDESQESAEVSKNPYSEIKKTMKPKKMKISHQDILDKLSSFHQEDINERKRQFNALDKHMKKAEQQKNQMLKILSVAFQVNVDPDVSDSD